MSDHTENRSVVFAVSLRFRFRVEARKQTENFWPLFQPSATLFATCVQLDPVSPDQCLASLGYRRRAVRPLSASDKSYRRSNPTFSKARRLASESSTDAVGKQMERDRSCSRAGRIA